ncbi:GFA family protein [Roseibium sp.]|uniref:GFA family protein n=1 Tax=Roseibium sp. TaxID=1936156 RepID=UPI003B516B15
MKGSCLCGCVSYEVTGPLRPVIACHCIQCRKTSGHFVAASQAAKGDLHITGSEHLTWFRSSETAKRGFCAVCGSQMFWEPDGKGVVSIMAGTLDGATGLHIDSHIYCESKGDYYELPQSDFG